MAKLTDEEKKDIKKLYINGIGSTKIAKRFSRSSTYILKLLKSEDIKIRTKICKLLHKDIKDMCQLYSDGQSASQIANTYNVSNTIILRYLKRNNIEIRNSSECHRKYPINEDFFDVINTEEKAYFLGFLYADGGNVKSGNFVRIELQKQDNDILHKFAKLIYKENPEIHVKSCTRKRDLGNGLKNYYSCYLNINSKHICSILEKQGCMPAKTFKITFPTWLDSELQKHFIRGYFDGDGSIYVNTKKGASSYFKITSIKQFAEEVRKVIIDNVNVNMGIYLSTQHSVVFDVTSAGNRQVEKIMKWLYSDANIFMDRKHSIYLKLLNQIDETQCLIKNNIQGYSKRYSDK